MFTGYNLVQVNCRWRKQRKGFIARVRYGIWRVTFEGAVSVLMVNNSEVY